MFTPDHMSTVWSAAPTPLLADGTLDAIVAKYINTGDAE